MSGHIFIQIFIIIPLMTYEVILHLLKNLRLHIVDILEKSNKKYSAEKDDTKF